MRRTDFALAARIIGELIHQAVIRQDELGTVADADAADAREVDAALCEAVHLLQHDLRVEGDTVADDAVRTLEEDTRRHQAQLIVYTIDDNGMAGIAAALEAHNCLSLLSEIVDNLALALIAPLGARYYYC